MIQPPNRILTLDIGTTAVKVSLFSDQLSHLCSFAEEYPLSSSAGGIVEVDPTLYLSAIKTALAKALQSQSGTIAAISVTTQGETLIPVDSEGKPLMNAIVWLDNRAQKQAVQLEQLISSDEFYHTTGLPEINGALPIAKLGFIKEELPHIYEKTYKFLLVEDYILHWLTGKFVTEKALLCSTGYFDIINDCYWDKALNLAGIDKEKLPTAYGCGEPIGRILAQTATELNISPLALVTTGAMDQVAAALGAGCNHDGVIVETTGTALVMAAYTKAPNFAQASRLTIYRHAIDGCYLYLPIGNTAGMLLKWFKDEFCKDICENGQDSYKCLDLLAKAVAPGCDGLVTLPYLAGNVNPDNDPNAKAVFFGATLSTTRSHFIRSIMESVCYMLRDFLDMLEELGVHADCIHSLGGGSRSSLWEQMKADVCQRDYASMQCSEATSMGAAILAAKGSGMIDSLTQAKPNCRESYQPNKELSAVYQAGYNKFHALYRSVKPLF